MYKLQDIFVFSNPASGYKSINSIRSNSCCFTETSHLRTSWHDGQVCCRVVKTQHVPWETWTTNLNCLQPNISEFITGTDRLAMGVQHRMRPLVRQLCNYNECSTSHNGHRSQSESCSAASQVL